MFRYIFLSLIDLILNTQNEGAIVKKVTLVVSVVFVIICCVSGLAQATEEKTELPRLFIEQKLDYAIMNCIGSMATGIAHAKSVGKTPE